MAYRQGDRNQHSLLPSSIEDFVPADAPVRAYDAMINAMDLTAMGFEIDPHRVGNSQYHPASMLKLLVYGYSYGVRSSRKLERECHYNLSFIWLTGGLKPDHKTIAEFRRLNKSSLAKVIRQCARICIDLDLIEGNILFIDGSRIRANAAIASSWTVKKCREDLAELDERISQLLDSCEAVDNAEANQPNVIKMQEELADKLKLHCRIEDAMRRLQAEGKTSLNTTDEDCVRMHSRQGSHAGYCGQIAVDDANGLIVNSDVAAENNDSHQLANQLEQANAVLDKPCKTVCADAGYTMFEEIAKIDTQNTDVIVPPLTPCSQKQHEFDKSHFTYDREGDFFKCPEGHKLVCKGIDSIRRCRSYYAGGAVCRACRQFGRCTTNKLQGRKIRRYDDNPLRVKLEMRYYQDDARAIFSRRKMRVEHPFGHFKRNLGAGHFLLRGLAGVRAEMSLLAGCFNIRRMISLLGVGQMIGMLEMRRP